jgi:hypothetical protein
VNRQRSQLWTECAHQVSSCTYISPSGTRILFPHRVKVSAARPGDGVCPTWTIYTSKQHYITNVVTKQSKNRTYSSAYTMPTQHHYEGHACVVFSDGQDVRDSGLIHVARWCQLVICESGEKAHCCAPTNLPYKQRSKASKCHSQSYTLHLFR